MNINGIFTAILAALCMGTMGVFSRKTGIQAELITFFRLFLGAGFLLLLLIITRQVRLLKTWPGWPVLINGLMLAGFIIFYVQAMYMTTMANAIMVVYLAPLVASIYAHFFFGEKMNGKSIILIVTALFGFGMMMEFKIDFSAAGDHMRGIISAALSMCCYAVFILINRSVTTSVHAYTRTFYQLLIGSLCMVPFFLTGFPNINSSDIIWIIGAGFIPGFLGILFAVMALEKLPAATFGTLAYFEPIFVVVLGWAVFGETLNALQLAGCLLIIGSGVIKGYCTIQPQNQKQCEA